MNFFEVTINRRGVGLFLTPLAKHRSSHTREADSVHANVVSRVIERHGFGEGIHGAFGCGVGRVNSLSNDSDQAGGVENTPLAGPQSFEGVTSGVKNTLHINAEQFVPFGIGGFV